MQIVLIQFLLDVSISTSLTKLFLLFLQWKVEGGNTADSCVYSEDIVSVNTHCCWVFRCSESVSSPPFCFGADAKHHSRSDLKSSADKDKVGSTWREKFLDCMYLRNFSHCTSIRSSICTLKYLLCVYIVFLFYLIYSLFISILTLLLFPLCCCVKLNFTYRGSTKVELYLRFLFRVWFFVFEPTVTWLQFIRRLLYFSSAAPAFIRTICVTPNTHFCVLGCKWAMILNMCLDRFCANFLFCPSLHEDTCCSSTHPPRLPHLFASPSSPALNSSCLSVIRSFALCLSLLIFNGWETMKLRICRETLTLTLCRQWRE